MLIIYNQLPNTNSRFQSSSQACFDYPWFLCCFSLSVHLARRVLKLEKMNTTLQGQLEEEKQKRDELLQEVKCLFITVNLNLVVFTKKIMTNIL